MISKYVNVTGALLGLVIGFTLLIYACTHKVPVYPPTKVKPKVGIIDTGYERDHPAFQGLDIIEIDCTGQGIEDKHDKRHGTGTLSRMTEYLGDSVTYVVGKGIRNSGSAYPTEVAKCAREIANHKPIVLNYSAGSKQRGSISQRGLSHAARSNIIVTKSSGNNGSRITFPCQDVLLIGSISDEGRVSSFSGYIPPEGCNPLFGVDHGERVRTAYRNGDYVRRSGTSFSAPRAAAKIAKGLIKFKDLPGSKDGRGQVLQCEDSPDCTSITSSLFNNMPDYR